MKASGDGVLLLHGQPGGARDWDRVVGAIAGRVPTVAVDRPGWDGRTSPSDLAGNALAAIATMDAHRLTHATIVGHSFGAAVACWLAAAWPERVDALVLAAPSANVASLYQLDRWLAAPGTGYLASAIALEVLGLALGARLTRRRIAAELALEESYLEAAGRALRGRSAWRAFVIEQRVLIRDLPALEQRLALISAPTTIVIGSRDVIIPSASPPRLAEQIPGSRLVVLEHAGHLLPLRQARPLAELVIEAAAPRLP